MQPPAIKDFCFWTVADGEYADMARATIGSARDVGVAADFHVWSDRRIEGAITHSSGLFDKEGWFFKFTFLRDAVQKLNYRYFAWFDTDTYFVRNPGNVLDVMQGSPIHIALECDVLSPLNRRSDWWGCPNQTFARLMREKGVDSSRIYNVNGGFVIVQREAVEAVFSLALEFYTHCARQTFRMVDEPLWSYVMHRLCKNLDAHTLASTHDLWASDWMGLFSSALPGPEPWLYTDYFTGHQTRVNPAIVHAMRSKAALIQRGRSLDSQFPQSLAYSAAAAGSRSTLTN